MNAVCPTSFFFFHETDVNETSLLDVRVYDTQINIEGS